MGGYLSQPVTEKASNSDENDSFVYGASAMQGWRPEMEDAHTHHLGLGEAADHGLFGVFDGHGGQEVALFCAEHLWEELQQLEAFKEKDYKGALHQAFMRLDSMVADETSWSELRQLSSVKQEGSVMRVDQSELPAFLHRAMMGAQANIDSDEDEDEMEDEVGDPNFDPDLQEDSDEAVDEDSYGEDEDEDPPSVMLESTEDPQDALMAEQAARGGAAPSEKGSGRGASARSFMETPGPVPDEEEEDEGEESLQRRWRPTSITVNGAASGSTDFASPRWSDGDCEGYYSDDYENYSDDEFDSIDDTSEASWGGKRLNSPLKRPKSKDGKRVRGSRPGTSESRPRTAPVSRPGSTAQQQRSPMLKSLRVMELSGSPQLSPAIPGTPKEGLKREKEEAKPGRILNKALSEDMSAAAAAASAGGITSKSATFPSGTLGAIANSGNKQRPMSAGASRSDQEKRDAGSGPLRQTAGVPEDAEPPGHEGSGVGTSEEEVEEEAGGAATEGRGEAPEGTSGDMEGDDGEGGRGEGGGSGEGDEDEDEDDPMMRRLQESGMDESSPLPASAPQAGCTAVVALVAGDRVLVANAGDSRCVCSRGGEAVPMSQDHKPDLPQELDRITKAGSYVAEGRINGSLNLSRAIGDLEFKLRKDMAPEQQAVTAAPEIREERLQEGDEFLVLACDGIWDVMSNQEVVDFVRKGLLAGDAPATVCEKLCDACLAPDTDSPEYGCDNMSAMVVLLKHFWKH